MGRAPMQRAASRIILGCVIPVLGCGGTGLNLSGLPQAGQPAVQLEAAINLFQIEDPRLIALPDAAIQRGDAVVIAADAIQITTVAELTVNPLPNVTVLGLKNRSGFDLFFRYVVDGQPQAVFVLDQETLVLQYPCLHTMQFLAVEEFEPGTGAFVGSFFVTLVELNNPTGFRCGDAVILQINGDGVIAPTQLIALAA